MTTDPDLRDLMTEFMARAPDGALAIAVSGGSDSLALLHLAQAWAQNTGRVVKAVTVNHGLRAEAAAEAAMVARLCDQIGVRHSTLRWTGWDGSGNLQDQARRARYHLLSDWARGADVGAVALGHTRNDQAETLLMRLGRGAGVDGLSAMQTRFTRNGIVFLRPLMAVSRDRLRQYLQDRSIPWIEDPSNQDPRFDRVKARQALETLADAGISADALSQVSQNATQARDALNWAASQFAQTHVLQIDGDLLIDPDGMKTLPAELQRRVLLGALRWIARFDYPPRRAEVEAFVAAACDGRPATLAGCQMRARKGKLHLFREYSAVKDLVLQGGDVWDRRWTVTNLPKGHHVRALGEDGLKQRPDWRNTGRPAQAVKSDPAIWDKDRVILAPTLQETSQTGVNLQIYPPDFAKFLFTR